MNGKEWNSLVAALERDGSSGADLVGSDGHRDADLAGHGGAADDGLVQLERLDDFADAADVAFFGVGVVAGDVVLAGEGAAVGGEIEGDHGAFLLHSLVVEHTVVLAAVAAGGVTEDDLLGPVAGLLVEDLRAAPDGGVDVDVSAHDVVVVHFRLRVFLDGAM